VAGVSVAGVSVARVRTVAVTTVPTMSGVPAMSDVTHVGQAADRHRGEARSAQREGEPIDVHTPEYYASSAPLVTGSAAHPETPEGHAGVCQRALQVLHRSIVASAHTGKRISRYFGNGQHSSETVSSI
jgi:hypothetical protein